LKYKVGDKFNLLENSRWHIIKVGRKHAIDHQYWPMTILEINKSQDLYTMSHPTGDRSDASEIDLNDRCIPYIEVKILINRNRLDLIFED